MPPRTGLPGLDKILQDLQPGDNIVWQIESTNDYLPFVRAFCADANLRGKKLVYFRFAKHQKLVAENCGAKIYHLRPADGFEIFVTRIHEIINKNGKGACYVFDSLSELSLDCFSERMTGNFFAVTCPLLHKLGTIAYFTVLRNYNSHHAARPIETTTQLLLDIYKHQGNTYVHPLKVGNRHSPTMYMLHKWDGDDFIPVTDSTTISSVSTGEIWHGLQSASYRMVGLWDRRFMEAEEVLAAHQQGNCTEDEVKTVFHRQLRQLISRDPRILDLAEQYLSLPDIIYFWKRTIGSGLLGGKTIGMLLARAILKKHDARWSDLLEVHDSFFIGSDIFYSFLIENNCWEAHQKQKQADTLFDGIEEARERILDGKFSNYILRRFSDMLDYYGQSPIIVRSSSLLEDNFGNAFAGKYDSVFCVNSGTRQERLDEFLNAVRTVYASTMSKAALIYRARRGLLESDEQMALLIQRVSGNKHGDLFFPHFAGVGVSYNSYVWDKSIDPEAGLLRLVFGLGTRAVDRCDNDYTRLVALNAPSRHPEGSFDEIKRHAQKRVDVLDLQNSTFGSSYFSDVIKTDTGLPLTMFTAADRTAQRIDGQHPTKPRILSFKHIFSNTTFIDDMKAMLATIQKAYKCHVDVEFTANFLPDGSHKINLVQCRALQVQIETAVTDIAPHIEQDNLILKTDTGVIGRSRLITVDRLIYVVPSVYGKLPEKERYAVARVIGELTHSDKEPVPQKIVLLGPGRWGTHMAALGVPVSFAEINTVAVICEIAEMHEGLTPDLSLGTHFFNDLVETDMLYLALMPNRPDSMFNEEHIMQTQNQLSRLLPNAPAVMSDIVHVTDRNALPNDATTHLYADSTKQLAALYRD